MATKLAQRQILAATAAALRPIAVLRNGYQSNARTAPAARPNSRPGSLYASGMWPPRGCFSRVRVVWEKHRAKGEV